MIRTTDYFHLLKGRSWREGVSLGTELVVSCIWIGYYFLRLTSNFKQGKIKFATRFLRSS